MKLSLYLHPVASPVVSANRVPEHFGQVGLAILDPLRGSSSGPRPGAGTPGHF